MAEENKQFRTSNQSRKKQKKKSGGLWLLLLIPLILALGIALGLTVRYLLDIESSRRQTAAPTETAAPASETSGQTGTAADTSADTEPANAESTEGLQPVTTPDSTPAETEGPRQDGSVTPTKAASSLLPVPDGIGRDSLSEGGWYSGKFVRDLATGQVKCEWDRTADLIRMLKDYGAVYHKNEDQKVCYLTFDCGGTSSAANVNEILDTLKEKNVKAVFFIPGDFFLKSLNREGESIDPACAAAMRRIVDEGHMIGSHTYTHPQMPTLSDEDFIWQLNTQQARIDAALGYSYPLSYYRPPEGAISERDLYLAQKMGYHVTLWSFAFLDWDPARQLEVGVALNKAEVGLHDGCVYLLHALSSTNRAMLGDLIDFMKSEGYDIRRIDR